MIMPLVPFLFRPEINDKTPMWLVGFYCGLYGSLLVLLAMIVLDMSTSLKIVSWYSDNVVFRTRPASFLWVLLCICWPQIACSLLTAFVFHLLCKKPCR